MEKDKPVRLAVRELVEYVLRSGDIRTAAIGSARAVDGTRAHQRFQKAQGKDYFSEVKLELDVLSGGVAFRLHGRADGIFDEEGRMAVDEIKTVGAAIGSVAGDNPLHWAQGRVYAYMYAKLHGLDRMGVRLTYIQLETFEIRQFSEVLSFRELEAFFLDLVERQAAWSAVVEAFKAVSAASIEALAFPFPSYRQGQKTFMGGVYRTIEEGKKLFARAPTGIGKTAAALFPSLKAYGRGLADKVFFLAAKTVGKEVAATALDLFEEQGARVKRTVVTAKEKTCLNGETTCNPEDCPYAQGHYDRVNEAIEALFTATDRFTREAIEEAARTYRVCPYELSLDMALFSDVILCDYNYVFDPAAKLRRFFEDGSGRYTLLVDEAHNLVDRGRDMYSAVLSRKEVLAARKLVKEADPGLYRQFGDLDRQLKAIRKQCEENKDRRCMEKDMPHLLEESLRRILHAIERLAPRLREWDGWDALLEFYFSSSSFCKRAELYSDKYITSYACREDDLETALYCLDPGENLASCTKGMAGVVFFSATLIPMDYYLQLLGGGTDSYGLMLPSPFDQGSLKLLVDPTVSTFYRDREASADAVACRIQAAIGAKRGNYLVYFPSYRYMELVLEAYLAIADNRDAELLVQERGLSEEGKARFLERFHQRGSRPLTAFAVLGGMFSEGIDLPGEKLIGVIITGVGLPQLCWERDLVMGHFDGDGRRGFDYAYVYPGMNKVLQAAGRVIRTAGDKGMVLLLDKRYKSRDYTGLFPEEWSHAETVENIDELRGALAAFWRENDEAD